MNLRQRKVYVIFPFFLPFSLVHSNDVADQTVTNLTSNAAPVSPPTIADRQLSLPQCGTTRSGGNDPFGLQSQFRTTLPPTTATAASAGARNGPIDGQTGTAAQLPLAVHPSGGLSGNDMFFAGLSPILEGESSLTALNQSDFGSGKRHVVPRILKRDVEGKPVIFERALAGPLNDAQPNQLCWQVQISSQLRLSTSRFAYTSCAGALVGPSTVLTAAHCILNPLSLSASSGLQVISPEDTTVTFAGQTTENCPKIGTNDCSKIFAVSRIIKHPDYNNILGDNDLALVILAKPVNLEAPCACTLCLQNNAPAIGETCVIAGYGDDLQVGNHTSYPLQWTKLTLRQASLTSSTCGFNVDDANGNTTNLEKFLCVGGVKGEISCQGDSGAPLVCYNFAKSSHYIAGISSFGPPCGVNIGAMYTNVAQYLPWIVQNSAGDVTIS